MLLNYVMPIAMLLTLLSTSALAEVDSSERPEHYKGKPANTLEQAVSNFKEYNAKLDTLVKQDKLSADDMILVHELTYTLENALAKINAEFSALADTLEIVHKASETHDEETVRKQGREYLKVSRKVVR
jgi:hypothetical protein